MYGEGEALRAAAGAHLCFRDFYEEVVYTNMHLADNISLIMGNNSVEKICFVSLV